MNRVVSVLALVALLVGVLFPMGVIAEESKLGDWAYSTEDGEVTLNYYMGGKAYLDLFTDDDVTLFIPARINGNPVLYLSDYLLDFITGRVRFEVESGSEGFIKRGAALLSADGSRLIACDRDVMGIYAVPDGVTSIGSDAFRGCAWVISVLLPDSVTEIGNWAFEDCAALIDVRLPETLKNLGYGAFSGCDSLTEIVLPSGITELPERLFEGCTALERILIPESVMEISTRAFYECGNLSEVEFAGAPTRIGEEAFYGCDALIRLALPEGLKTVAEFAFYHCVNLAEIQLPKSLTNISDDAFRDCPDSLVIRAPDGSEAQKFAWRMGYRTLIN